MLFVMSPALQIVHCILMSHVPLMVNVFCYLFIVICIDWFPGWCLVLALGSFSVGEVVLPWTWSVAHYCSMITLFYLHQLFTCIVALIKK